MEKEMRGPVCVFLADGFEEVEGLTVVDVLRRAGIPVKTVSIKDSRKVKSSHGIKMKADKKLLDIDFAKVDMIVLPGGLQGTQNLEACEPLLDALREFNDQKRPIAAICAAPRIFAHLGFLNDKPAACNPCIEDQMGNATIAKDKKVVSDGHIITSCGMGTALPFALAIVKYYQGQEGLDKVLPGIVYSCS